MGLVAIQVGVAFGEGAHGEKAAVAEYCRHLGLNPWANDEEEWTILSVA